MQKEDCFLVGTVFKLHGYKGDVKIYNDNNILFDFKTIEYFLINQNNCLVPYFINQAKHIKPNIILVKFDDIDTASEAKSILKQEIYLPAELVLKKDNKKDSNNQLIGCSVLDIKMGVLGNVIYINSQTDQQLIYVSKDGKEFCFPMHEQFVKKIKIKDKIIEVKIPEEFLTLN